MKKFVSLALAVMILALSLTACGETIKDEWVLVSEEVRMSEEFDGAETERFFEYKYDTTGRLIGEKRFYRASGVYVGEQYQHDDNGNVIAKTEKFTDSFSKEESYTKYTYAYDNNNRLINETSTHDSSETFSITYDYDERGTLIKETTLYKNGKDTTEYIDTYVPKYEDGVCVETERISRTIEDGDEDISYYFEEYLYDENGNKTEKKYYTSINDANEAENPIEKNGRYYKLFSITRYAYAKLKAVAVDVDDSSSDGASSTTTKVKSSEIGFYNIEDWGCKLIEIQPLEDEFVFEDSKGKFVVIQEGTGFWEFYPDQSQAIMSSYFMDSRNPIEASGQYSVLDDNTCAVADFALRIVERVSDKGENAIHMTDGGSLSNLYIPYSKINVDSMEFLVENGKYDYYMVYLNE